jgi:hypothetical protein
MTTFRARNRAGFHGFHTLTGALRFPTTERRKAMNNRGNQRRRGRTPALIVLVLASVLLAALPARATAPVQLSFEKQSVGIGMWEGTVSGDIEGDLTTVLTACLGPKPCAGTVWHVEFDWIIDAGDQSFTAHLRGTLNTVTGRVVMNGTVVDGYLEGARVHEEGQLVDPATLGFEGIIRVLPATA